MIEDSKHYALAITCGAKRGPKDSDLTFSPAALRDFLKAIEQAEQAQPVAKPLCKVVGMPAPGRMCPKIIVGGRLCGFTGECEHKQVTAPPPRQPEQEQPVADEHQAFIDSLPVGDDKMYEQIHHWARQSYRRHKMSVSGQMISAGDATDSHIIWATLRWAKENTPPPRQPVAFEGWRLVPVKPTQMMAKAAADAWLDCNSKLLLNKSLAAVKAGINAAPAPRQPEQAQPENMVLVPRNPTPEQIKAGDKATWPYPCAQVYKAMLDAAPPPPRQPLTDEEIKQLIFRSGGHKSTQNLMSNPMQVREHIELWNERIYKFARAIEAAHGIKKNT